jgi:hypothetical protein
MPENPDSFSQVRRPGVGSGNNSPARIIPQRGKVSENHSKPPKSEHWAVFHPYKSGLNLANDPGELGPQPASFSANAFSLSGGRYVLTRESPTCHVNHVSPRKPVKRRNVIPDGELGQASVSLPLQEDLSAVRLNLDSTDAGMSEKHSAKDASSGAGEEMEFSHGFRK